MNFKEWLQLEVSAGYSKTSLGRGIRPPESRSRNYWGQLGWPKEPTSDDSPPDLKRIGGSIFANIIGANQEFINRKHPYLAQANIPYHSSLALKHFQKGQEAMREIQCPYCKTKFPAPNDVQSGETVKCQKCRNEFNVPEGIKKLELGINTPEQNQGQPERWQLFTIPKFQNKSPEEINHALQNGNTKRIVIDQIIQDLQQSDGGKWAVYQNQLDLNTNPRNNNIQYNKTWMDDDRQIKNDILVMKK